MRLGDKVILKDPHAHECRLARISIDKEGEIELNIQRVVDGYLRGCNIYEVEWKTTEAYNLVEEMRGVK